MIVVTKLNNSRFAVNPDLIERIHSNPDTTLALVDGTTYIVTESMEEVIELIANYRAKVISIARASETVELRRVTNENSVTPFPSAGSRLAAKGGPAAKNPGGL
ncbi:flagellar FlbD family protein [Galbitalea soli]|uniref:Flagellar FlbD family protein n=1 Tax=Galbitalea soli TaxID=1268042 RepID=A0A7C9TRB2_9MICO|nr:flagellar FlbD family protein [Galbitalea soli]NEM91182.1 flagellar FlbD family protein [Galbitalea soli]NYJ29871.1 flagellar protein FlbD [Galbitalea soli]